MSFDPAQLLSQALNTLSEVEVVEPASKQLIKPKRNFYYGAIHEDTELEEQIDRIQSINLLSEKQMYYMVLRDINYFIDIYYGLCVI